LITCFENLDLVLQILLVPPIKVASSVNTKNRQIIAVYVSIWWKTLYLLKRISFAFASVSKSHFYYLTKTVGENVFVTFHQTNNHC